MPTKKSATSRRKPATTVKPSRETRPQEERTSPRKPIAPRTPNRTDDHPRRPRETRETPQHIKEQNTFRRFWMSSSQRYAHSELIWIGNKQMLCWQSNIAEYILIGFDPMQSNLDFWDGEVLDHNSWRKLKNCRLAWLGGNDLLAWEPDKAEYTIYRLTRERPPALGRDSKIHSNSSKPSAPLLLVLVTRGQFAYPVRKLISLGRQRLLVWNEASDTYQIWKREAGLFNNLTSSPRLSQFIPPEILDTEDGHLYFTWSGRNTVVAWNARTQKTLTLGFTDNLQKIPNQFPVAKEGLDAAGKDYAGPVMPLIYQSSNRQLLWNVNRKAYTVQMVGRTQWDRDYLWDYCLEDYLESSPTVQNAITWFANGQEIPITDWDLHGMENLHTVLTIFYGNFTSKQDLNFTYRAQDKNKVGPDLLGTDGSVPVLKPVDAEELYLAQIAQNLWAEISGKFSWRLADYTSRELSLLLRAGALFKEYSLNNQKGYCIDDAWYGYATPTDPSKSFWRLSELGIIRTTPKESIFSLAQWFINHLCHGPGIYIGDPAMEAYGFRGFPPLIQMLNRLQNPVHPESTARNISWSGCHSAAGLMVGLSRCLNIPARSYKTWESDHSLGTHHGVDFPTLRLFSKHADDFYAEVYLLDSTIEASEIFDLEVDYSTEKDRYTRPPHPGEDRPRDWVSNTVRKGLNHPTHRYLSAFFDAMETPAGHAAFVEIIRQNRLTPEEAENLIYQYRHRLQAAADAFTAATGLSGSDASSALLNTWSDWTAVR